MHTWIAVCMLIPVRSVTIEVVVVIVTAPNASL
jgi:hypothetical protein